MTDKEYTIKLMPPSFEPWESEFPRSRQIAVMMSGGVDSSVTAYLLKEAGWDVLGITMKIPVSCDVKGSGCCGADAAFVCNELSIPHYFVDVTEVFENLIIQPFRQAYAKAQTPNPCVDCNTILKFSLVWDFIEKELGIENFATGHYARVYEAAGEFRLGRAKDKTKDQSYFLYGIAKDKLRHLILPLGELTKQEVRDYASKLKLSVADKAESMELCFAGQGDYRAALGADEAEQPGDITDMDGNVIGAHKGISNYTLGQRKGIGFAGGKPLYVGKIDKETNTIALGTRDQICSSVVRASQVNVLIRQELVLDKRLYGKIRSYGDPRPCKVTEVSDETIAVEFDETQFAPCPGQRLVLYDEDKNVVVGGTIFV